VSPEPDPPDAGWSAAPELHAVVPISTAVAANAVAITSIRLENLRFMRTPSISSWPGYCTHGHDTKTKALAQALS
jgi:hypothetical protein